MPRESDPTPIPNHARLTGDERRRTLLAAARREFARAGYHGAGTASIARAAGCSEPMLYKHFSSKLMLFLDALRDAVAGFQAWFDETLDPSLDVREQAARMVSIELQDPAFMQLLQLRMLAVGLADKEPVRDVLAALERSTQERIVALVDRAREQGTVRDDIDPMYVAWGWLGLMLASCYRESWEPGSVPEMTQHVGTFIALMAPAPA
jgi:AcrR family transcriptional regulator